MNHAIPIVFARRVTLSRAECAETLGRSTEFVDRLIERGKLRTVREGRAVLVIAADLWAMLGLAPEAMAPVSDRARAIVESLG